ncbi:hypothetical protein J7337_008240 [Fusarium musae]|uniref:Uncharacterized protein n=1 Tax=Fusarium musae TaxID=1042133 RepID=A0A9P8DD62_9HYPO|nr:hypothetical protein J7337_008240 [Fusarium musae]KAG9499780.1 hypothetical protein J7337_008240 [Fusarium musae]
MANPGFLMPDLIEKASKLSIDDLDTNKSVSSISRYQEFPYARFFSGPSKNCDGPEKTSPDHEHTWKNEVILMIEKDDQHSWNSFILDPRSRMEFDKGVLEDLETFLPFSNDFYPFPSYMSHNTFTDKLFKKRVRLAEIKGLIETGRRELARPEGSDAFIQLRNDFVKYHEEVAAKRDLCDVRDETVVSQALQRRLSFV